MIYKQQAQEIFACYEMKVAYKKRIPKRFKIQKSSDSYEFFKTLFNETTIEWTESCYILCLNKINGVIGFYKLSEGGTSGVLVDSKVIYSIALQCGASSVMVAHNHPSGNLKPSPGDEHVTKQLKEAGKVLDIALLDHLIISSDGYYSFADEGKI